MKATSGGLWLVVCVTYSQRQADAVEQMMALAGYHDIDTKLDTQQIWRAVEGRFD